MSVCILLKNRRSIIKNITLAASVISISTLFLTGCYLMPKEEVVLAPPIKQPHEVTYETVKAKKTSIEKSIECTGTFVSVQQEDLFFTYRGGRLKSISVKEGDTMKKGDVVAELDTDNIESQIERQKIAVEKSELALRQVELDGSMEIETARLQLESLKKNYDSLKAPGSNSTAKDIENLELQIKQQEMRFAKAQAAYGVDSSGKKGYSRAQAELNLKEAGMRLDELVDEYNKSRLLSPISGKVVYVNQIKQGEYVNAYTTLVRIADPTHIRLQYSDKYSPEFLIGNIVSVDYNKINYSGEVVMTPSSGYTTAEGSLKNAIRIKVDNLPKEVKIGEQASIKLIKEKRENTIVIPLNTVTRIGGRSLVHVLKEGIRYEKDIKLGLQNEYEVEVLEGLQEGEDIVLK